MFKRELQMSKYLGPAPNRPRERKLIDEGGKCLQSGIIDRRRQRYVRHKCLRTKSPSMSDGREHKTSNEVSWSWS